MQRILWVLGVGLAIAVSLALNTVLEAVVAVIGPVGLVVLGLVGLGVIVGLRVMRFRIERLRAMSNMPQHIAGATQQAPWPQVGRAPKHEQVRVIESQDGPQNQII